jgi:hypothetical protein
MTDEMSTESVVGDGALTLERYLRELPALDAQQLLAISAAHANAGREAIERAREAAAERARADGLLEELQALQGTIAQWIGSRMARSRRYTGEGLVDDPMLQDVRDQARPALLDAAAGLFLADWLSPEDRDALVGPVESVLE